MIKQGLSSALLALLLPCITFAGVIRHDVDDLQYQQLAYDIALAPVGPMLSSRGTDNFICSATAIASHWVLTAAHCLEDRDSVDFFDLDLSSNTYVKRSAASWLTHENWTGDLLAGWDIGLMHFEQALTTPTAQLYDGRDEFLSVSVSVGYGTTGNGLTGPDQNTNERRAGVNIIDAVFSTEGTDNILFSDFDHPTDESFNFFTFDDVEFDDLALDLEYSLAPGDSGGGLFILDDDELKLAGVHSFVSDATGDGIFSNYGDVYGSTRVSSFTQWINDVTAVPEPHPLMIFGLVSLLVLRRRKASKISRC